MSLVVAIVVWVVAGAGASGLFVWWWLGVHRKPRDEQASEIAAAAGALKERKRTDFFPGAPDATERPHVDSIHPPYP